MREFTSTSRPEVLSWVLSFRAEAELMEPADIREEAAAIVEKLGELYSPGNHEVPSIHDRAGSWMVS